MLKNRTTRVMVAVAMSAMLLFSTVSLYVYANQNERAFPQTTGRLQIHHANLHPAPATWVRALGYPNIGRSPCGTYIFDHSRMWTGSWW